MLRETGGIREGRRDLRQVAYRHRQHRCNSQRIKT